MTYGEKIEKMGEVKKQTKPNNGQTELVVKFDNGSEIHTFCLTEKINETAKSIKESLAGVVSVGMIKNK